MGICMNDFGHYFRDVSWLEKIDIYRFLDLFGVTGSPHQHAIKKIACAGQRGAKDARKDLNEAMESIRRALEMLDEDERKETASPGCLVVDNGVWLQCVACHTRHSPRAKCPALDYSTNTPAEPAAEPAAEIDDDSPRAQAMGQNGNNGEHYPIACRLCRKTINPMLPHLCK
jgi:hypothetical protein